MLKKVEELQCLERIGKPRWRPSLLVVTVSLGACSVLAAGELSLREAVEGALAHNLDIKISALTAETVEEEIEIAGSVFDPTLSVNLGLGENLSAARDSRLEDASVFQPFSESWDARVSASKKIPFGTTFSIGSGIDRRETNSELSVFNPEYNSDLFFSMEQPLLRGLGREVNLTARLLAESSSLEARVALQAETLDVLRDTELRYWQLAYERARRDLRQSSIDAAEKLLAETEERERVGVATRVDVLQARAALASRQESVILAEEAIARTQDQLAEIVGAQDLADQSLSVAALPTDLDAAPGRGTFVSKAMAFDLDRRAQLEVIRRSRLELERARQLRRPELNLRLEGSYLGRDTQGSETYRGAFDREGYNWRGGLEFSLPWGLRAAKARERQARRELRIAKLDEARIEQSLFYELRGAWRDLETGQKRLVVAEAAVQLQTEQYAEEKARYSAGLVTLREVLEAQEDLDAARLSYLDALIDSVQAQVVIRRLDGTLMARHQLTW